MMGRIPLVGELHKRILKTFGNIIRKDNSIEKDIAITEGYGFFPKKYSDSQCC
jgi:hypothetical protein